MSRTLWDRIVELWWALRCYLHLHRMGMDGEGCLNCGEGGSDDRR